MHALAIQPFCDLFASHINATSFSERDIIKTIAAYRCCPTNRWQPDF